MQRVLITGITGFAGSHLAEYFLAEHPGVEVFGTYRWRSRHGQHRASSGKIQPAGGRSARLHLGAQRRFGEPRPDAIFHLAAQSFVPSSWDRRNETLTNNVSGQTNLFEAVRSLGLDPVDPDRLLFGAVRPGAARRGADQGDQPAAAAVALRGLQGRPGLPRLPVLPELRHQGDSHPRLQPHRSAARARSS